MDEKVCFLSVSSPLPPEQCCRSSTACENIKIKLLAAIQHCRRGEGSTNVQNCLYSKYSVRDWHIKSIMAAKMK